MSTNCTAKHLYDSVYQITYDDIVYTVDAETKTLMRINAPDIEEIIVPHKFPTGQIIKTVGDNDVAFIVGHHKRIVFSDGIRCFSKKAFLQRRIDEVVLPQTCIAIPERCFLDAHIKKISGAENIQEIGNGAFSGCTVETFNWPANVKTIPAECFYRCGKLKAVSGLENVESIGYRAFSECSSLTELSFGDLLTHINLYAFSGCQFETFDWPSKVKTIEECVFYRCKNLCKINGIEAVTEIKQKAFSGCLSLKSFTIPDGVTAIPRECFAETGLSEIKGLEHITEIGVAAFCNSKFSGRFRWPDGCSVMEPFVLSYCNNLTEVYNLDHVIEIKGNAFDNSGIEKIDLSNSVCFNIAKQAFANINPSSIILPYYLLDKRCLSPEPNQPSDLLPLI